MKEFHRSHMLSFFFVNQFKSLRKTVTFTNQQHTLGMDDNSKQAKKKYSQSNVENLLSRSLIDWRRCSRRCSSICRCSHSARICCKRFLVSQPLTYRWTVIALLAIRILVRR